MARRRTSLPVVVVESFVRRDPVTAMPITFRRGRLLAADDPVAVDHRLPEWSPPRLSVDEPVVAIRAFIETGGVMPRTIHRGALFSPDDPIVVAHPDSFRPWTLPEVAP